jgi:chromosome segregation ATPase
MQELTSERVALKSEMASAKEEIHALQMQVDSTHDAFKKVESDRQDLLAENQNIKQQLQNKNLEQQLRSDSINQELQDAKSMLETKMQELDQIGRHNVQLEEALNQQLHDVQEVLQTKLQEIQNLQQELDEVNGTLEAKTKDLEDVQQQQGDIEAARLEAEYLRSELAAGAGKEELQQVKQELQSVQGDIVRLVEENVALKQQLEEAQRLGMGPHGKDEAAFASMEDELQRLRDALAEKSAQCRDAECENQTLRDEVRVSIL